MVFLLDFHFPYVAIRGHYSERKFGRSFAEVSQKAVELFPPGPPNKGDVRCKADGETAKQYNDFAMRLLNRAVT